jgi:biopolymer transport protein ExbB/TolQ
MRGVTRDNLRAVKRACDRSAKVTNHKMKRGVDSLAVIASTAPLVGILGMLSGIPAGLKQVAVFRLWPCGDCAGGPAEVFVLPAIGLLVGSAAMLFHAILFAWGERFRLEMKIESLEVMNGLVRRPTKI